MNIKSSLFLKLWFPKLIRLISMPSGLYMYMYVRYIHPVLLFPHIYFLMLSPLYTFLLHFILYFRKP